MKLKFHQTENDKVAEVITDKVFSSVDDFLDIMGDANFRGANSIIIYKKNIHDDFFNLKTKLAGEVLQKFSNYKQKLAIIGDFSNNKSKSLNDFIKESNKYNRVLFLESVDEAIKKLA